MKRIKNKGKDMNDIVDILVEVFLCVLIMYNRRETKGLD